MVTNVWTEKYRPQKLNDYIGMRQDKRIVINYIQSVYRGKPIAKGLLFSGKTGSGKTTLAFLACQNVGSDYIYRNASDRRNKSDMDSLHRKAITGERSVIILDEAEGIRKMNYIKEMVNDKDVPLIVITENEYNLSTYYRKSLQKIEFTYPTKRQKLKYVNKILEKENKSMRRDKKMQVAQMSKSFRDVPKWLQIATVSDNLDDVDGFEEYELDMFEEFRHHLTSREVKNPDMQPREILEWAFDNGCNHELISKIDRILGKTQTNDYRSWKYAYRLMRFLSVDDVEYPYSFKMRSEVKEKIKEEEQKEKEEQMSNETVGLDQF